MKINTITKGLLALGLVSAAGIAQASSTIDIGGQTYNEVFLTGSSAARGNIFNAVSAASGGVFDSAPTLVTAGLGAPPTGSTGNYTAYGKIGGQNYCLCMSFTGSEAGLWAIQHNVSGIPNAVAQDTLNGNPAYPNAVIPGTPNPTSFVNPNDGTTFEAQADLAMADTSQAVSLSPSPALTDYGVVGAVTFYWMKGKNSSPDSSWNNLVNVTTPQLNYLLSGPTKASYFTGVATNADYVFVVGRNKASGTHQNTMLDTLHGTTVAVDQWVPGNCTYNGSGQLSDANGTTQTPLATAGLVEVFNDGFDSGSGVSHSLMCDGTGSVNVLSQGSSIYTGPVILLGYLGVGDATAPKSAGAQVLTVNGVAESDATVINGTYSYWGHEHLYGVVSPSAATVTVAHALAGTTYVGGFGSGYGTPNGAIQNAGGLGGGGSDLANTHSSIIAPNYMQCDKPNGGDSGYPAQL
ncbi:MAG TPA: hypothetical protein VFY06_06925 [Verrucomicrobiae bacterium]|nr:hypothetical protein [Verrucomicrobiae bacterium]